MTFMEKNESLTKSAFLSQIISIYHLQRFKIVLSVLILPLRVLSGLKIMFYINLLKLNYDVLFFIFKTSFLP